MPAITADVRVPITPAMMASLPSATRFSVAGQLAWLPWTAELGDQLSAMGLAGMSLRHGPGLIGKQPDATMMKIVQQALDPQHKFS